MANTLSPYRKPLGSLNSTDSQVSPAVKQNASTDFEVDYAAAAAVGASAPDSEDYAVLDLTQVCNNFLGGCNMLR